MSQHEFPIEIFDILDVDYQMLINSDENENSNWPNKPLLFLLLYWTPVVYLHLFIPWKPILMHSNLNSCMNSKAITWLKQQFVQVLTICFIPDLIQNNA